MTNREKDPNGPVMVTLEGAQLFLVWASNRSGVALELPSAQELQGGWESGNLSSAGSEWTREGWLFNPVSGEIDKSPAAGTTAGFRLARNNEE